LAYEYKEKKEMDMVEKRSPELIAVEAVHKALLPLDAETRKRVLRSVYPLLDIVAGEEGGAGGTGTGTITHPAAQTFPSQSGHVPARQVSIVELIREKQPGTSAQRIALFAYYREKHEGLARFGRADLEPYFGKPKETPATNYDRDFVEAVKKGWIHEDGENSYITSRGIEAVEAGFAGERKYVKRGKKPGRPPVKTTPEKKTARRKSRK
jgi:hypothetical protein